MSKLVIGDKDETLLPVPFYADIAPLPISFALHQLPRFQKLYAQEEPQTVLTRFLKAVHATRETAFEVLDDFVRNRHLPIAPHLRLSTEWLTRNLAAYDPLKTMPSATFKTWQRRGIIRMEAHGKPTPASAAAVLITRMLDRQKENIFPEVLPEREPDYWCTVVESLASAPQVIPITLLDRLPPSAIVWTWPGAAWEDRWASIGQNEGNLAAIRFAGTKLVKGERWWNVELEHLRQWDPQTAALYQPTRGHHERQIENLATVVLDRVYTIQVPRWNIQTKTIHHSVYMEDRDVLTENI